MIEYLFNLKKKEFLGSIIFFLYYYFLISSIIFGKTARDVFFLSRYNPQFLPQIFIISSIFVIFSTILFIKIFQKRNIYYFAISSICFFSCSLFIINYYLNNWLYPFLYVWIDIIAAILIPQFWLLANSQFSSRQAKRLFGPISAAAALSNISIGSIIQFGLIPSSLLLPISSCFLIFSLIIVILNNLINNQVVLKEAQNNEIELKTKSPLFSLFKNYKYVINIGSIVIVSSVTITLIEYQFKMLAANTYNENQLTSLFGMLYCIVGIVSFIIQFFLLNRFLTKYGILVGLTILPIVLGISSIFFVISPIVFFALTARLSDLILRYSINDVTMQLIWMPVSDKIKRIAKPFIDGAIKNSSQGLAGLLIICVLSLSNIQLFNYLIILLLIIWIVVSISLKSAYLEQLKKSFGRRSFNLESLKINILDSNIYKLFNNTLKNGSDRQKLFVINEIKNLESNKLKTQLDKIFFEQSSVIQKEILLYAENDNNILSDNTIINISKSNNKNLKNKGILIGTKRKINEILKIVRPLLRDPDENIKAVSNLSLIIFNSDIKGEGEKELYQMLDSEDSNTKYVALKIISSFPYILSLKKIDELIDSNNSNIKLLLVKIISEMQYVQFLSKITSYLNDYNIYNDVIQYLKNFDYKLVEKSIINKLHNSDLFNSNYIKSLGDLGNQTSLKILIKSALELNDYNEKLMETIITSCNKIIKRNNINMLYEGELKELIISRFQRAYVLLDTIYIIQKFKKNKLFLDYMFEKLDNEIHIILNYINMIYKDKEFSSFVFVLNSNDLKSKSNLLDFFENKYSREICSQLIPLINDSTIEEKYKLLNQKFIHNRLSIKKVITTFCNSDSDFQKIIAIDLLIKNNLDNLLSKINCSDITQNIFIIEMILKEKRFFNSKIIKQLYSYIDKAKLKEPTPMYTTLDITLILKDIELFSNLTNDDIFNIAKIANIENFIKNEIIFEKGEEGDAMYIVIDGSVSIFNGNNEIAILGAGECFGELALLDGEPRSTSIKSIDDTIVIKISKEEFYSLISDKIEIVKGIIKILSSRLRNTIS